MAINYWVGLNRGETQENAVAQNTDPTKQLEISWDAAQWPDRGQFFAQLEMLENRIIQLNWPVV